MFDFLLPDCWVSSKMRSPGIQESWSLNYKTLMGLSLTSAVLILCIVMFYRRRLAKKIEKQQKEVKLEELMNQYRELDAGEDYIRSLKHVETFIGEVFSDGILPETIQLSDALEFNEDEFQPLSETLNENKMEPPSELPNVNKKKADDELPLEIEKPSSGNKKQVLPQKLKSSVAPPSKPRQLKVEKPICGSTKVLTQNLKSSLPPPSRPKPRQLKIEKPCCRSTKVSPKKLKSSVAPPSKPRNVNKMKTDDKSLGVNGKSPMEVE